MLQPTFQIERQDFHIEVLALGPLQVNTIILHPAAQAAAWLFDGGADASAVQTYVASTGKTITALWHTHAHLDHMGTSALFASTIPGYLAREDLPLYEKLEWQGQIFGITVQYDPQRVWQDLPDQGRFAWGAQQDFMQVLATPGHTPGGRCFYFPSLGLLFSGDTLFAGAVGRTDLPGGDWAQLKASLQTQILPLPETTTIIPGHGPCTTLKAEKNNNPYLQDLF